MHKTLLIADDYKYFVHMIAVVSTCRDWDCAIYLSGHELLGGQAEIEGPALLLLDILMPDLDGIETILLLEESQARRRLCICIITGGDHSNATAAGVIAVASAFNIGTTLYKPLTIVKIDDPLTEEANLLLSFAE